MRRSGTILSGLLVLACGGAPTSATNVAPSDATEGGSAGPAPVRLLDAEEADRTYTQAMQVHVRAEELRARCVEERAEEVCGEARQLFGLADDTWRALVEGRPDDTDPEWLFMLAQARFHAGRLDAAGEAAERYLSTGASDWRTAAARLLLATRERALEGAGVRMREEPPQAQGSPPAVREIDVPPPVQQLVQARDRLVEVLSDADDARAERRSLALANALVLYRYGHWERVQPALRTILEEGCTGEGAWEGAATAWRALHDIALALERYDAVRALGDQIEASGCEFGLGPPSCAAGSEHPRCMARTDRALWGLRGGTRFLERAQHSRGAEAQRFAIRAGEAFLAALEDEGELDALGRVTALVEAEGAFRRAGAAERAAEVDVRIVREVDPRALDESDRPFALAAVASAVSRQLDAALEASRHEEVVTHARWLLSRERDVPELSAHRAHAREVLPEALVSLGRHADASRAFGELASASEDPSVRRQAELRGALELVPGRSCAAATRPLRTFVSTHSQEEGAQDSVVRALWQLAECQRRGGPQHVAVLEEVVQAGARGELDREARGRVAEATFLLADRDFESATRLRIHVPAGENIEDMAANLREQLAAPLERLRVLLEGYAGVERHGVGRWTVAARQRSGAALEALDRAVLAAAWELPLDLTRQRRLLNAATFAQIQRITEMRAAELLRAQAVPIRCRAAAHYRRALEVAGTASVDSDESRSARERLAAMELPDRCPTR